MDSDWVGDISSRMSMSDGILCYVIKTWSTLQKLNALSAEAEYLAMIKGVREAMALQALLQELGLEAIITVHTDRLAAKTSAEKSGLLNKAHATTRTVSRPSCTTCCD